MNKISIIVEDIFSINKTIAFCIIVITYAVSGYLIQNWLVTNEIIYQYLSEMIDIDRIDQLLKQHESLEWVSYVMLPFLYLIKFIFISSSIWIGCFFYKIELSFSRIFGIVIASEITFIFIPIIKLIYFSVINTNYTLQEIQFFYPLSVLQLVNMSSINTMWVYPLQVLNFFEIMYCIVLSFGLSHLTRDRFIYSLFVVVSSYGSLLVLWALFICFLTISNKPL